MRIGIDVSQLQYQNTGVANYLKNLLLELVKNKENEYVLFYASFRNKPPSDLLEISKLENVKLVKKKIPPTVLNIMWNKFHQFPIEKFIGKVDLFITSDWAEPRSKAKKATIIYDLIVFKHPNETDKKIVKVQKKKLSWVKKESDLIFCISESTKKDAIEILGIDEDRLKVIYPGFL